MKRKLSFSFTGRSLPRDYFLRSFKAQVALFVKAAFGCSYDTQFLVVMNEMVKNIYDHNGGWGYAEIEMADDGTIFFWVGNADNPTPETNEIEDNSANCGIGLKYLFDLSNPEVKIEVIMPDDSRFVFNGKYIQQSLADTADLLAEAKEKLQEHYRQESQIILDQQRSLAKA